MERTLPAHLKKYQGASAGFVPSHAEKAITQHMQKTVPKHMQKFVDPYVQQNVISPSISTQGRAATRPQTGSKNTSTFVPNNPKQNFSNNISSQQNSNNLQPTQQSGGQGSGNEGEYDFIMNPDQPSKQPLMFVPNSTLGRTMIFAVGIIFLIILIAVGFSLLNASANKQKDNLLEVAQTQSEIIRVIELGNENVFDASLEAQSKTLKTVVVTSQQEILAALSARGKTANDKDLAKAQNSENDSLIENGLNSGRHDQVFTEVLTELLGKYAVQLETVYDNGSSSEQSLSTDAYQQINIVFLNQDAKETVN